MDNCQRRFGRPATGLRSLKANCATLSFYMVAEKVETPASPSGFFASRVGDILRAAGFFGGVPDAREDDGLPAIDVIGEVSPTIRRERYDASA